MTHRLKNWLFARDLMCTNPRMTADIISNILRSDISGGGMNLPSIEYNNIVRMVNSCGCAISQDGLEASLTIWSQTLSVMLTGDKFDEFLSKFDETLEGMINKVAREHNW